MPAPARISVPVKQTTPIKPTTAISPKTPASIPRPKARVVHRRRARGRLDDTDTDEDLVREPHSDDDSDSASSMLDSESETVSDSEPEPGEPETARVPSPSHTPLVNGAVSSPPSPPSEKPAAFPQSINWSEMVADENANGAADLPVIDFADLSSHTKDPPAAPAAVPSPPVPPYDEISHDAPAPQMSHRKPGQSARQAYLSRLDTDPAYVPTLGQFWSHDDRLLDKDLRSLSGWWRGRWQGRGRARGFAGGWGMRGMRGRGGFGPGAAPSHAMESHAPRPEFERAQPVDRAWTHDGFEEMKVDDEKHQHHTFRGRGAFPRGRGGFRDGFSKRGGLAAGANPPPRGANPPPRAPSVSQHSATSDTLQFGTGTRPWFAMKPERVWTKQFDAYLYFEAPLKPVHNQGLGQGVRVRLPGSKGEDESGVVVRLPQYMAGPPKPVSPTKEPYGERAFVVRLPRGNRTTKEHKDVLLVPEDVITVAPPPMDDPVPVFPPPRALDTRPSKDAPAFTPAHIPASRASGAMAPSTHAYTSVEPTEASQEQGPSSAVGDFATAGPSHFAPRAQQERIQPVESLPPPPIMTSLQTSAAPFQPSPPYGSPYGYATPGLPLPPGIAVSENGVTYEVLTGRAVFLHTPPPPPPPPQMQGPVYNPRPMMHHAPHGSVHFLPPPHHAPSLSISPPGFLASPPIFSLPRQSSRVEIRAPGYPKGKEREQETEHAAGDRAARPPVRSAVNVNAEPFTPAAQAAPPMGYYGSETHPGFDEAQRHHHHASIAYQGAPYYYHVGPEGGAPYGYGQYAPMDVGQPQQYEQYAQDPYPQQQHTGYY